MIQEDFKELGFKQQEKYLNKYVEGKSPHKKGTKKYKQQIQETYKNLYQQAEVLNGARVTASIPTVQGKAR